MEEKGLVSIVTPCYNGEDTIYRLLDSVLLQDYDKIEFIVVDDGSTDSTSEVVKRYVPKFNDKGINLIYLYQENQGQATAINKGLEIMRGEFFIWPDSDDFFSSSGSIRKMVEVLMNSSDDVGMVRCAANIVDETLKQIKVVRTRNKSHSSLFVDCILEKNGFYFTPGTNMVKSELLKKELIDNQIDTNKEGQNWQILLPMLYNYKCIVLSEILFTIVQRKESHSRQKKSYQSSLYRLDGLKKILVETIKRMKSMPDQEKYYWNTQIEEKYLKKNIILNIFFNKKTEVNQLLNTNKKLKWDVKQKLIIILFQFNLFGIIKKYKSK